MKLPVRPFARIVRWLASSPIKFFVVTSLVFGFAFIILVPPFQIPDEFTHFTRSYEVSELKTGHGQYQKKLYVKGSELPKSILLTYNKTWLHHKQGTPDVPQAQKYSWNQTSASLNIPLNKSIVSFYNTGAVPAYVPPVYVPQAIIIKVLSLMNAPVIVMLYATRLVGLLIWISLAVLALRVMPPTKRRLALASVLLLPMFIAQASVSTDPLLTGTTVLYLVFITNMLINKEVLTKKKLILLTVLLLIMVMAKPVYIAFGILLFATRTRQSALKGFIIKTLGIATPFILYCLWSALTKDHGGPLYIDAIASSHADPSMQVGYLVPNIFNFFEPFVNTLLLGWGDGIYVSVIGDFGKLDTPLPLFFIALGYTLTLIAVFVGVDEKEDERDARAFCARKSSILFALLTSLIFIVGVYLAMYVYSTPPHERVVTGVQGRYLLPLLPLLTLFVAKSWVTMRETAYDLIMTSLPLILLVVSTIVIFLRFYVLYP